MKSKVAAVLIASFLFVAGSSAQVSEALLSQQIKDLRSVPDATRPAVTSKIATDIRTLPAGPSKVKLADALSQLVTEGDPGQATIQAVADTLSTALSESPIDAKDGRPAAPYMDLARLVRYEGATSSLAATSLKQALDIYSANDADAAHADFTLKDLRGKPVTLSQLHGKIVLVSFWATWCPPCRKEMSDLDLIYTHYQSQGLVILSISSESAFQVNSYIRSINYHPEVLIDDGAKVAKEFHVDGLPRTFVYDRDGKLVAEATDMRTQQQFFRMLAAAGLKPM